MDSGQKLAKRTLQGIAWAYGAFFGRRVFTFFSTAILARLLVPDDFGLIGFALLILNFIEVARGFGINDALIYNSERLEDTNDTAFWLNVVIGTLQTTVTFLIAPLTLYFFDDPRLVDVVRVLSFTFVFNALGETHRALLQKELQFKRRFFPDLASSFIKGVVSIVLALTGSGVWSLVIGHLVSISVQTVALWWVIHWRPRLRFFVDRARALWQYGVHILMLNGLTIALEQADQLTIGSLLGQTQLGYYTIAAKIPELVIANFSMVLTTVLFPTFAKLKDDRNTLIQGFLATTRYTAFVTFGAGFGMAAVAPELVRIVYGDQWGPAVDLFRVLAFLGVAFTIPWAAGDVLKAIGRPDISTKLLVVESLYSFPLIIAFGWYTRMAVMASFANLLAGLITAVLRLVVTSRFLKMSPAVFLEIFRAPFISAASMFGAVTAWRMAGASLPDFVVLSVSILLGAVVYCALLFVQQRAAIMDAYRLITGYMRGKPETVEEVLLETSGELPGDSVSPAASD